MNSLLENGKFLKSSRQESITCFSLEFESFVNVGKEQGQGMCQDSREVVVPEIGPAGQHSAFQEPGKPQLGHSKTLWGVSG